MKPVKLSFAVALVLAAMPLVSFAQDAEVAVEEEAESPISWELTGGSDYVFRGVSQTNEKPTGQAGITYTTPIGLYVGAWASGVDFGGNDPRFEVDSFIGYNVDLTENINFDVMANRYNYPDAGKSNYWEFYATTTFMDTYNLTVTYTDDVFNTGTDAWYYSAGAEWGFGNDYTFGANVGHSVFDDNDAAGVEDYTDWGVSVGKSWGMVSAKLGYVGTDGKGKDDYGERADSRVVLTLSVGQ